MSMSADGTRRALLLSTATAAGWLAATACGGATPHAQAAAGAKGEQAKEEVPANEDLMRTQHVAGRELTQTILRLTVPGSAPDQEGVAKAVRAFVRMYRPHAAREDTVVFPALHAIVSPQVLADLGERFEDVEHERFGKAGFESVVRQVEEIEKSLGIYELAELTPG